MSGGPDALKAFVDAARDGVQRVGLVALLREHLREVLVSFGLVLARLEKGARFTMEKTKINDELWMPVRMKVDFDARLALFKKMKVDLQIDYTNFRKFQSESRVLSQE